MRRLTVVLLTIVFLSAASHFANANDYDACHKSEGDPASRLNEGDLVGTLWRQGFGVPVRKSRR